MEKIAIWIVTSVIVLLVVPGLIESGLRLLYLIVSNTNGAPPKNKGNVQCNVQWFSILVVIPAWDEASIIGETVSRMKTELSDQDGLVVIADNCTDQTGLEADSIGAKVFYRNGGSKGKGHALAWFAATAEEMIRGYDYILFLDADSLPQKGILSKIREGHDPACNAAQTAIQPFTQTPNGLSILASYSDLLSQKIDGQACMRLGWSVPLRGTGMLLESELFINLAQRLTTLVDDIELSLLLAILDEKVAFLPEAVVIDTKSVYMSGLARQRGRWLKGQRQILKKYAKKISQQLSRGISQWSIIQALLYKPKTLFILIKVILLLLLLFVNVFPGWWVWLLWMLGIAVLIDMFYYFAGLWLVENPWIYLFALIKAPIYFVLWGVSWYYSLAAGQTWLKVRTKP
jgi:cellulose synthase/poly-beta-1,6-N-acetylglucosamine synthase-like glycosyltransferase